MPTHPEVVTLDPNDAEHAPLQVVSNMDMPFVLCSCDDSGYVQTAYWLTDHWQGTAADGVSALKAVVDRQRTEGGQS